MRGRSTTLLIMRRSIVCTSISRNSVVAHVACSQECGEEVVVRQFRTHPVGWLTTAPISSPPCSAWAKLVNPPNHHLVSGAQSDSAPLNPIQNQIRRTCNPSPSIAFEEISLSGRGGYLSCVHLRQCRPKTLIVSPLRNRRSIVCPRSYLTWRRTHENSPL